MITKRLYGKGGQKVKIKKSPGWRSFQTPNFLACCAFLFSLKISGGEFFSIINPILVGCVVCSTFKQNFVIAWYTYSTVSGLGLLGMEYEGLGERTGHTEEFPWTLHSEDM